VPARRHKRNAPRCRRTGPIVASATLNVGKLQAPNRHHGVDTRTATPGVIRRPTFIRHLLCPRQEHLGHDADLSAACEMKQYGIARYSGGAYEERRNRGGGCGRPLNTDPPAPVEK
jgi:hypothetical protein